MEIDKKYRLEKAVSTHPVRTHLHNIHVSRRHAFATNGSILAIVPVATEKDDTPGWLTPDALKLGRKAAKSFNSIRITLNGKQILPDGTQMARPGDDEKLPRLFSILRAAHIKRQIRFGINVSYLKDLADAIGSEEVVLEFAAADKAILVRPIGSQDGERGIIMPVKVNL